jgi:hypothetical protein
MSHEEPDADPRDDAYLCDRVGDPPEDILRWERLLAQFREATPIPPAPDVAAPGRPRAGRSMLLLLAASLLLAAGAATYRYLARPAAWELEVVAGMPRVEGHEGRLPRALAVGSVVTTDASSRVRIRVGTIGWVDVASLSTIRIVAPLEDEFRMAVDQGTVRAEISAPPGMFVVETPHATAIDLGCIYTLRVSEQGDAVLTVESGWVLLESADREALVPEGAEAATRRGRGPGSPYYRDAPLGFREALRRVDFGDEPERHEALGLVLLEARPRDALTLLTLLRRVDAAQRVRIHDRLALLLPPPADVTRSGIAEGDLAMIDRWWTALKLDFPKKKRPVRLSGD